VKPKTTTVILIVGTIFVWLTAARWIPKLIPASFTECVSARYGQFGDTYGVLNSIFSGMALIGAVVSIFWQLNNSRSDGFENRLFKMMEFHYNILNEMRHSRVDNGPPANAVGRNCFQLFCDSIHKIIIDQKYEKIASFEEINKIWNTFFLDEQNDRIVGHYLRNLFHIFKYIDNSFHSKSEKEYLAKIVRAQLSQNELIIIYLNGLSSRGRTNTNKKSVSFKTLIEKYHLLEDIHEKLFEGKVFPLENNLYSRNAFFDEAA
jgi:hypothetical protein